MADGAAGREALARRCRAVTGPTRGGVLGSGHTRHLVCSRPSMTATPPPRPARHALVEALLEQASTPPSGSRRELSRRPRRLLRAPGSDPLHRLPAGRRRRLHGRCPGQAQWPAGHLLVTRGPGASKAAVGLHSAFQDSTPLVSASARWPRPARPRGLSGGGLPAQVRARTLGFAKWVGEIEDPDRLPEYVARAFTSRCRAGPARWCCRGRGHADPPTLAPCCRGSTLVRGMAFPGALARLPGDAARRPRPIMIVGGSGWDAGSVQACCALPDGWIASGGLRLPTGCCSTTSTRICRRCRHRPQPEAREEDRGGRPRPRLRTALGK
jgi:acetolactate synthase-1/2/3 large subunit